MYSGPGATVSSQGAESEASTLWARTPGAYQSVNVEVRIVDGIFFC